jgi:hypothetical protein
MPTHSRNTHSSGVIGIDLMSPSIDGEISHLRTSVNCCRVEAMIYARLFFWSSAAAPLVIMRKSQVREVGPRTRLCSRSAQ